jgi:CRISPR system Cascade subunit CasD
MPEKLLLLRLEAPMQSWGVRARWDVRDTGPEPTKSGIAGLLGCALKLRRGAPELARLCAELRFGVRADRPGEVATDYHTVTGYHRTAEGRFKHTAPIGDTTTLASAETHAPFTVQSYRDYLHDASFLVALAGAADLLSRLAEALQHPAWPIYLGRKSCVPTRPVFDDLTDRYEHLEDALRRAPWAAPADARGRRAIARTFPPERVPGPLQKWAGDGTWKPPSEPHRLTAWVEDEAGDYERQDVVQTDALRFYGFRRCRRLTVSIDGLEVMEDEPVSVAHRAEPGQPADAQ